MICINNFETIVYIIYNILSTFVIPKYNLLLCMLFVDSLRHLTINDFYNKLCNGFMHLAAERGLLMMPFRVL